ncbi:GNAT family N-acetyltransferase [Maledivibacter halophilus]|uniref:Ribosomal-protein-alanine N-acetyltransferase n=1 Tax=Maledivibacter halophilus TaxID=36842 RepID=A0A1T5IRZ2_9FIRM|nr:GNAT family N-acetyltransferase [Maledivibacter halophilus]SKC41906.1 ribosomal-protein-alanine N-acetyltransferase [Maledivibacter halophilus]
MSSISIRLLKEEDSDEIFEFEIENREFFESIIPARWEGYYIKENFEEIIKEIIEEQELGIRYMYIIRDQSSRMVGRVNLFSVVRGIFQKAELGYRIGSKYNKKGYATKAVNLILKEAFKKYKLHRVEAATSPKNIGSQIVLIKNGFQFVGKAHKNINVNGTWTDSVYFEILNGDE